MKLVFRKYLRAVFGLSGHLGFRLLSAVKVIYGIYEGQIDMVPLVCKSRGVTLGCNCRNYHLGQIILLAFHAHSVVHH